MLTCQSRVLLNRSALCEGPDLVVRIPYNTKGPLMRVFLTGVGCVGKTTIGKILGELLAVPFFDLDHEIEVFFGTSIERLQNRCLTMHSYRNEAAKALMHLLNCPESQHCVIGTV